MLPGQLILGADSHTPHFGWMGAFGAGIGRSEVATLWATGELWLRVPESIRITLDGDLPLGVTAKDFALRIIGDLGADGGLYASVEFDGPGHRSPLHRLTHGPPQHDGRVWGEERVCRGRMCGWWNIWSRAGIEERRSKIEATIYRRKLRLALARTRSSIFDLRLLP